MALETKLNFVSQDKSGRKLTVVDATGSIPDNPNGYGPGNGEVMDILSYYFVLSMIHNDNDYVYKMDGTDSRNPSLIQAATGAPIDLYTDMFSDDGKLIFIDGVMDINMYVEFFGSSQATIQDGDSTITATGGVSQFLDADAVIVNDTIYQINHSLSTGATLVVIGEFESDSTSFNILYRSNIKALLMAMSENNHSYACDQLNSLPDSPEWNKVNVAASMRLAAKGFFNAETPDYFKADTLINSNFKLLKKYTV